MVLFFSLIFILKLDEAIRNEEIFIIFCLSKVQIWGFGVKKDFFFKFLVDIYPLDPDPWIRIILRIRIQEAKILRILSTVQIKVDLKLSDFKN